MDTILKDESVIIRDHGQIDCMTLPAGWIEGESQYNVVGDSSFRQFHPPKNKDVALCFFYSGRPADDQSAVFFQSLLEQPPHSLNPAEIRNLAAIIREKASPVDFTISVSRTENLNDRTVLFVEGRYELTQQDCLAIYLDADGSGKYIQEIFFRAPTGAYDRFLLLVKPAINSIEWKR